MRHPSETTASKKGCRVNNVRGSDFLGSLGKHLMATMHVRAETMSLDPVAS